LIPTMLGGSSTTGHCDRFWRVASPGAGTVYIPAGVGSATYGAALGVSCVYSHSVASHSLAYYGGALASDDPTDTIPDGAVVA
jgi:hypothetical protein